MSQLTRRSSWTGAHIKGGYACSQFLLCFIPVRAAQAPSNHSHLLFINYSPQIVLYQLLSLFHNVLELPHLPHSGPKPATFLSPAEEQKLVCLAQPPSLTADTSQPLSRRYCPRRIDRSRFHRASSWAGGFQRGTKCQKAFHWLLFFSSSLRDTLPKRDVIHI